MLFCFCLVMELQFFLIRKMIFKYCVFVYEKVKSLESKISLLEAEVENNQKEKWALRNEHRKVSSAHTFNCFFCNSQCSIKSTDCNLKQFSKVKIPN